MAVASSSFEDMVSALSTSGPLDQMPYWMQLLRSAEPDAASASSRSSAELLAQYAAATTTASRAASDANLPGGGTGAAATVALGAPPVRRPAPAAAGTSASGAAGGSGSSDPHLIDLDTAVPAPVASAGGHRRVGSSSGAAAGGLGTPTGYSASGVTHPFAAAMYGPGYGDLGSGSAPDSSKVPRAGGAGSGVSRPSTPLRTASEIAFKELAKGRLPYARLLRAFLQSRTFRFGVLLLCVIQALYIFDSLGSLGLGGDGSDGGDQVFEVRQGGRCGAGPGRKRSG